MALLLGCGPTLIEQSYTYTGGPEYYTCDKKPPLKLADRKFYVGDTEIIFRIFSQASYEDEGVLYRTGPYRFLIRASGMPGLQQEMFIHALEVRTSLNHRYVFLQDTQLPYKVDFSKPFRASKHAHAEYSPEKLMDLNFERGERVFVKATLSVQSSDDSQETGSFDLEFYPYTVSGQLMCGWPSV